MFDEETGVYTVQAEDMDQHGFRTVRGNQAAGGELVKLTGSDGKLSTEFGAESGVYDLTISAQDESDGVSTLQVFVNGELQGTIKLDQDDDGRGSDNGGFSDFTLDGLNISEGDNVEVRAWKDNGEFVRIDQLEFAQVEQQAEPTPTTVVIQAEDLELNGFKVVSGANAEGGELVRLTGGDGRLSTDFSGVSGTYDLTIYAQDESDGVSRIDVYVGGELQDTIYLDQQNNGGGSNNGNFSDFTIEGLEIENGEQVEIRAWRNDGELVRIDQLTFEPVDAAPEPEGLVCIDFEGLTAGAVVSNQFDGVTISAQRDGEGGINSASPNDAMIFDGANPTGGDADLTASGDNVLIISEDNDSSDPDDNAGGGTIWFEFDTPSFVSSINVLDAEEGGRIRLLDENDQLIQEITIPGGVDGGIQTIDIDVDDVAQIDLTLNGSGAIDDLKFVPGDMPELASVAGTVFMDNNDNSVQDAGDMAQAGVEVILFQSGVGEIARTTTDANGNYLFENVTPGEGFRVQFDNVDGKDFVEANVGGDDTIDSDAIVNPGGASTDRFDLAAGENKTDLDAGVELIDTGDASLAGVVFMDNNDNDIEDASDMRLSGVEVTLLDGEGNTVGTATTDANGAYEFLGLDAGDYTVQFPTNVDGKSLVGQDVGGDDTVDSDADQGSGLSQTVSLGIGERIEDIDAGVEDPGTASLAGRVFMDNNNNSIDDAGDMGVAGVGINLLDAATGAVVAQTNADADGNYIFENLDAGEYVVEFGTLFTGKVNVDANVGGDDTVDSDVVTGVGEVARGRTEPITVNIGDAITDVDNGLEDLGSLSGRFFLDTNRDGQDNDGANGIASVTVELLDEDGNGTGITTTTDADGNYSFGDLLPGEYGVKFTDTVSGRDLTAQNVGNDATDSDAADIGGGMSTIEGITVNAGQDTPDNDAGVLEELGSLSGRFFMDTDNDDSDNNNGDEPAIEGVLVMLLDAAGTPTGDQVFTDADGNYAFGDLEPGEYGVKFTDPNGVLDGKRLVNDNVGDDTSDSDAIGDVVESVITGITVSAGEDTPDNDAGAEDIPLGSIGGTYFMDNNDNDVQDAGDMGLAGQTVTLLEVGGGVVGTTTTDADGNYLFEGLDAGDYVVSFDGNNIDDKTLVESNVGGDDTIDSDIDNTDADGNFNTGTISLGEGEDVRDVDAGVEQLPGSLSGRFFMDTDNDDSDNNNGDEPAIEGVLVMLLDAAGTPTGDQVFTDADGNYAFGDLEPGEYGVKFTDPNGVLDGKRLVNDNVGDDTSDSDAIGDVVESVITGITVSAGEDTPDNDAGAEDIPLGSIGGTYFMDNNDNDVQDAGDMGLAGQTVTLLEVGGGVVGTTTTDADGNYLFEGLDAGDYVVSFDGNNIDDKTLVESNVGGDDTIDSDIDNTDADGNFNTGTISLGEGEDVRDVDAGVEQLPGSLSGRFFMDTDNDDSDNNNGDEPAIEGVLVMLLDASGTPTGDQVFTDADGNYSFGDLEPGEYGVKFTDPNGVLDGKRLVNDNVGDDTSDSDAIGDVVESVITGITVSAGEDTPDNDAGAEDIPLGSIGGTYFMDNNDNDVQDAGDMGLAGQTVTLLEVGGGVVGTTTTDADGNYLFEGLDAGDYVVSFDGNNIDDKTLVESNVGGDDTIDSDIDNTDADGNFNTGTISLGEGEDVRDVDAGVEDPGTASVGNFVFFDNNGDGIFNAGDTGADGVEVKLFQDLDGDGTAETQISTQFTSNGGQYLFNNLNAGTYAVMFGTLAGFGFTAEGAAADDAVDDDSDAGLLDGMTDEFILSIGEAERDVDAGLVALNEDPEPEPDVIVTCAEDAAAVMVLDNDSDPDGDPLSIVAVDGQAFDANGQVTTANGTIVSLLVDPFTGNVSLVVDGSAAYEALDIDETAVEAISYTVDDGNGNTATTELTVTFKGDANSVQSISDSLPSGLIEYQIADGFSGGAPFEDFGYDIQIGSAGGDLRFEGIEFTNAYCLDFLDPAATARDFSGATNTADLLLATDADASSVFETSQVGINGETAADNLDLITWILNQDFENTGAGSVDGNFTGWEVQFAIWELTNSVDSDLTFNAAPEVGQVSDVDFIVQQALANGEGFEAGVGDIVGVILDPNPATATNSQPFIVGIEFEDLDCLCPADDGLGGPFG